MQRNGVSRTREMYGWKPQCIETYRLSPGAFLLGSVASSSLIGTDGSLLDWSLLGLGFGFRHATYDENGSTLVRTQENL